jgi:hypothetical protein
MSSSKIAPQNELLSNRKFRAFEWLIEIAASMQVKPQWNFL